MRRRIYIVTLSFMLAVAGLTTQAATHDPVKNMTAAQKEARIEAIGKRVNEIREMDKSTLNKSERKALKKELRSMHKESKELGHGGIYLTLGGVLVIILVLIIIL